MNADCPSELALSMHADRALPADAAVATELHLAGCADCRARLARLRSEVSIVAAALSHDAEPVTVPVYRRPVSRVAMAATAVGGLLVALLVAVVPDVIGNLLSGPITWFNPFDRGTYADLGVEAALYLAKHGGAIMTSIAKTALMAVFTTLVGWFALVRRRRNGGSLLLAALLGIVTLEPLPSHALTLRHDQKSVVIPAGETIDDTLIASGENVDVAGTVTGDLIAVGRNVQIRGHVGGQVFTVGRTVDVSGDVAGSVTGIAETLGISSSHIGSNLYGVGSTLNVTTPAHVDGNAIVCGERVLLAGAVGRDVLGGAENVDVSGRIGGTLTAYAGALNLLAPAHVAGNVLAYVQRADNLTVSPGAVVAGEVKTKLIEHHAEKNRYLRAGFYVAQLVRFVAAFVAGAILLAVLPKLREISIDSGAAALRAGGVGLVALVATPIIAVLVAVTLIGIPVGIFGLLLWVVGLYLAKIVVGNFVGERLLDSDREPPHFTVPLAVGLALVIIAVNLPLVGGVINFLLTILGLGLLVIYLYGAYRRAAPA